MTANANSLINMTIAYIQRNKLEISLQELSQIEEQARVGNLEAIMYFFVRNFF
jgi:hypothetical protein